MHPDISISQVRLGADVEELVLSVLRSGQLAQGPMVARFEEACASMAGTRHAVAVNNGTTALVLALQALDLGPGDEVVTSPFTFVATLNAILESGATACFADIGDDFNLDPDSVRRCLNDRTKVVMPVHLFGLPADMDRLVPLAAEQGAVIVEDSAQAHGAMVSGRPVGSFGLACFSFYATKNITTGEGGVVTTDDDRLADRMRVLRNQGMRQRYEYELGGNNYRLTDVAAAIAIPQFARLDEIIAARRANADALTEGLKDLVGIRLPHVPDGRASVWHQYTVEVTDAASVSRDAAVKELAARGIGCGVYYPRPVYDYDCYRDDPRVLVSGSPRAEQAAAHVLSLPVHDGLSAADVDRIVTAVWEVFAC